MRPVVLLAFIGLVFAQDSLRQQIHNIATVADGIVSVAMKGVLVDVTGAAIPRGSVRVLQPDSNKLAALASSEKTGAFEVESLPPGSYTLTAVAPGFFLRKWINVLVREGETNDLGKLELGLSSCDGPGVICDTFTSAPVFPGLIRQGGLNLGLQCGADLRTGKASCPANGNIDLTVSKDAPGIYVKPGNGAAIFASDFPFNGCRSRTKSDRVRVDGFGPNLDFCVRIGSGMVSHVFVVNEVEAGSAEVRIWFTTIKQK